MRKFVVLMALLAVVPLSGTEWFRFYYEDAVAASLDAAIATGRRAGLGLDADWRKGIGRCETYAAYRWAFPPRRRSDTTAGSVTRW